MSLIFPLADQDVRSAKTTKGSMAYGQLGMMADGRTYQFSGIDSTGLASGQLAVAEADADNHVDLSVAAAAIGAKEVTVTLGATAATADQYAEGYLNVRDGTGEGHYYKIQGHPAADASATLKIRLYNPIEVALVASGTSQVDLAKHPAKDCGRSATLAKAVGVSNIVFAASTYGWLQKTGYCSVISDGTPAKNQRVIQSNGTAGSVEVQAETDIIETVGIVLETLVNAEHKAVALSIA